MQTTNGNAQCAVVYKNAKGVQNACYMARIQSVKNAKMQATQGLSAHATMSALQPPPSHHQNNVLPCPLSLCPPASHAHVLFMPNRKMSVFPSVIARLNRVLSFRCFIFIRNQQALKGKAEM